MNLSLAIDTTGRGGHLALADHDRVLGALQHDERLGHAESLFELMDELLRQAGLKCEDLERVAVVRGPGSFTGLRIGIITAKGIAFARSLALWSAPTLPLLASAGGERATLAVLSAGEGQLFAAAYRGERELLAPVRLSLDSLRAQLASLAVECCAAAADARTRELARQLELPLLEARPLGECLALCAARGVWPAEPSELAALMPEYLALSQAERVHGVDLSAEVNRPGRVEEWE